MKIKTLIIIAWFVLAMAIIACTDAERANWATLGDKGTVTLYGCDGKVINSWISTGKISTESGSDGWNFKDSITGKFIRVSGTVVIEN